MKSKITYIETEDPWLFFSQNGGKINENDSLEVPAEFGKGYLKNKNLFQEMILMFQQYELKLPLKIKRNRAKAKKDIIIFSFRNVFSNLYNKQNFSLPSVQISSPDMKIEIEVPANFMVGNILIGVPLSNLKNWINNEYQNQFLEIIEKQPYLYDELISSEIQKIAQELFSIETKEILSDFLYKIKAEELIYSFLKSFLNRKEITNHPINSNDVRLIFSIRDEMIKNLDTPPQLDFLAQKTNMSVSKLSKLFRQIFGDSIYNYYQKIRMQKAAKLLKDGEMSVSDVGYQLGFTNLSHFSRLFEKHHKIKPKKYSSGRINATHSRVGKEESHP